MRTITPIQLYLLSFFFLFAGLFSEPAASLASAGAKTLLFLLFAVLAMGDKRGKTGASRGLRGGNWGLTRFFTSFTGGAGGFVCAVFFLLSIPTAVRTALAFSDSVFGLCPFLPWSVIFLSAAGMAVFLGLGGVTALGRTAELLLFLLVPMVLIRPFGAFSPAGLWRPAEGIFVLLDVPLILVFFLAEATVTSGDAAASDALSASGRAPQDRGMFIFSLMAAGALSAFLLYLLFSLFSFGEADVFGKVLLWMLYALRLGLFGALFSEGAKALIFAVRGDKAESSE